MKTPKILLVAGLLSLVTGSAYADSSFTFAATSESAPSMVEVGGPSSPDAGTGAVAPAAASISEKPLKKIVAEPEIQTETPQTSTIPDKSGDHDIAEKKDDDTVDPTVTASAQEPKPFFENSPFSASDLRR
jgi:hypothetical protein